MKPADLKGWTRFIRADGWGFFPPNDDDEALRLRMGVSPLVPMRTILARAAEAMDYCARVEIGKTELGVTLEGEHSVQATITGWFRDKRFERHIAVVYGDHDYTRIDAITKRAEQYEPYREIVKSLAFYSHLGLGVNRVRRFWYREPAGWSGLGRARQTDWFPTTFPDDPATLTVFDALPLPISRSGALDLEMDQITSGEIRAEDVTERTDPIKTFSGLEGILTHVKQTLGGRTMYYDIGWIDHFNYRYLFRLGTAAPGDRRDVIRSVMQSMMPVPRPAVLDAAVTAEKAFGAWYAE